MLPDLSESARNLGAARGEVKQTGSRRRPGRMGSALDEVEAAFDAIQTRFDAVRPIQNRGHLLIYVSKTDRHVGQSDFELAEPLLHVVHDLGSRSTLASSRRRYASTRFSDSSAMQVQRSCGSFVPEASERFRPDPCLGVSTSGISQPR